MKYFFLGLWRIVKTRSLLLWHIFKHRGFHNIPKKVFIDEAEKHLEKLKEQVVVLRETMPPDLSQEEKLDFIRLLGEVESLERDLALSKLEEEQEREIEEQNKEIEQMVKDIDKRP